MSSPQRNDSSTRVNVLQQASARDRARTEPESRAFPRFASIEGGAGQANPAAQATERDSKAAFELLDLAASVLPALMTRCHRLEAEIETCQDKARGDLEAAESARRQWQFAAQELNSRMEDLQKDLRAMTQRAELAEAQSEIVRITVERARQQAAKAEGLSAQFHDKVVSALGAESPAHAVLEAWRNQDGVAMAS